jgi:uncharacterized protein HemY
VLINLDRFESLTIDPCLTGDWVALTNYERVIASPESYQRAVVLAAVDFINSAAWILVVVVLELEVRSVLASSDRTLSWSSRYKAHQGIPLLSFIHGRGLLGV